VGFQYWDGDLWYVWDFSPSKAYAQFKAGEVAGRQFQDDPWVGLTEEGNAIVLKSQKREHAARLEKLSAALESGAKKLRKAKPEDAFKVVKEMEKNLMEIVAEIA
jgi:hypothetical protein